MTPVPRAPGELLTLGRALAGPVAGARRADRCADPGRGVLEGQAAPWVDIQAPGRFDVDARVWLAVRLVLGRLLYLEIRRNAQRIEHGRDDLLRGAVRQAAEHRVERAEIVIGADGRHSLVAEAVRPEQYHEKPPLLCGYYTYWSGLPMHGRFETWVRPERGFAAWPTNDDLTVAIVGWPFAEFEANKRDIEGNYLKTFELASDFADRVRAARREARFVGTSVRNYFRRPYGPGWALVGDAGYHKDPILALGISDAFRDAELLAQAVDAGLSGRAPLARTLADYERRRNELSAHGFQSTIGFARLQPPPPDMQQLFAALRDNPRERDRLFGTFAGTVPPDEYFAPDNLARILMPVRAAA